MGRKGSALLEPWPECPAGARLRPPNPGSLPAHWARSAQARAGGPGRVFADDITAEGSLAAGPAAALDGPAHRRQRHRDDDHAGRGGRRAFGPGRVPQIEQGKLARIDAVACYLQALSGRLDLTATFADTTTKVL